MSQIDDNTLQEICQQVNTAPSQTKSALASALPILLNTLAKNSSDHAGASALQNAISRDHDGRILDNLGSFLNQPEAANGAGILKYVQGYNQQIVE